MSSETWSLSSIASSRERGDRLELGGAAMGFSCRGCTRSAVKQTKPGALGGAPGSGGRWLCPSGGAETVRGTGINDRRWWRLRVPTMNSSTAHRCLGEGAKGVEEERLGYL
jgi:hypothetical protein